MAGYNSPVAKLRGGQARIQLSKKKFWPPKIFQNKLKSTKKMNYLKLRKKSSLVSMLWMLTFHANFFLACTGLPAQKKASSATAIADTWLNFFFRLPQDLYQTAKVSKLLILMENGQGDKYWWYSSYLMSRMILYSINLFIT